ncbi:EamA family transporter [Eubacteriaceae bacterium ES3]|nr:EamA family transporter [Eubacteriaceae bacterium ES3]
MKEEKGIFLVALAMILFSTGGFFIKLIDTSATTITFVRAIIACLMFMPFMQWKKLKISSNAIILALAYSFLSIVFVLTTKMTTAANAIIFQCTAPLWLYAYYVLRGKKIEGRELMPRILILIGIVTIFSDSTGGNMVGDLLALSNGIAYAFVQYYMDKEYSYSDVTVTGLNNLVLAFVCIVLFNRQFTFNTINIPGWIALLYLGVFQIGVAYLVFLKGVKRVSALKSSMIALLEPILNPIFVMIFVGEVPSALSFLGFALILSGIVWAMVPVNLRSALPQKK